MSAVQQRVIPITSRLGADQTLRALKANEIIFAVVGPVGSGTSQVATALSGLLSNSTYGMKVDIVKASDVICSWLQTTKSVSLKDATTFEKVTALQDAGDEMRSEDQAAVAIDLIASIKEKRSAAMAADQSVASIVPGNPSTKRAYILDSLNIQLRSNCCAASTRMPFALSE
jgi:hypothetical protein